MPPSRPSFGSWTPAPPPAPVARLDRARFAGLTPEASAGLLIQAVTADGGRAAITLTNKRSALRRLLKILSERGKDLSNVTRQDLDDLHAYLKELVAAGVWTSDTCSNLSRNWNSALRVALGATGEPGEGLLLKGFQQHAAKRARLTQNEFDAMMAALDRHPFKWMHSRLCFETYMEIAWSAGPRIGSLLEGRVLVRDVDLNQGTVTLRHMKNAKHLDEGDDHVIVLTPRAVAMVKRWIQFLQALPIWKGDATILFCARTGEPATSKWVNETLHALAAAVGIRKPVTTHVLRKTCGTIIGATNPKLAQRQLGISAEIFEKHYNFPLLEDRLAHRDILPGGTPAKAPIADAPPGPPDARRPRHPRDDPPGYH